MSRLFLCNGILGRDSVFEKKLKKAGLERLLFGNAAELKVKFLPTDIGRKEIEDALVANFDLINTKGRNKPHFKLDSIEATGAFDDLPAAEPIVNELYEKLNTVVYQPLRDVNPPPQPGVYQVCHEDKLIYTGETRDLKDRIYSHKKSTRQSAFRRNVGRSLYNFELHKGRDGKKMYFNEEQDKLVDSFIDGCRYRFLPIYFGRAEFEEDIIKNEFPDLNRLGVR